MKADRQPLADFLKTWLEEVCQPRLAYSTLQSYESYLNKHVIPELGHIKLGDLRAQDVQKFLNSRPRAGLKPRTVQYIRAILRSALSQAVDWGYLERNLASIATPPRMQRREPAVLSAAEARTLIEATADDRLGNLFATALFTGLRQGELLGLRWIGVDLETGSLEVRFAIQKQDGAWRFVETKSERSRRKIVLPAAAVAILKRQRERVDALRRAAGSAWQEWHLVFPSQLGTPLDGPNVTHHLKRKLNETGLPAVRFHDLRHTCATLLLENGVHERTIMEQLGHSKISLILNTYSHVRPAMLAAAAGALDRAIGPTGPIA